MPGDHDVGVTVMTKFSIDAVGSRGSLALCMVGTVRTRSTETPLTERIYRDHIRLYSGRYTEPTAALCTAAPGEIDRRRGLVVRAYPHRDSGDKS